MSRTIRFQSTTDWMILSLLFLHNLCVCVCVCNCWVNLLLFPQIWLWQRYEQLGRMRKNVLPPQSENNVILKRWSPLRKQRKNNGYAFSCFHPIHFFYRFSLHQSSRWLSPYGARQPVKELLKHLLSSVLLCCCSVSVIAFNSQHPD